MTKDRIVHVAGIGGLLLAVAGAILYAVNAPQQKLMYGLLITGAVILAGYLTLNLGVIRDFFRKRSSRYGANMVVMIVLFTVVLVIIQTLSSRHSARYDLTRNKRFSLATQTVSLLENLDRDIVLYAFYKKTAPDRNFAEDLLGQYAHRASRLRYEFIDPDQRPELAREMAITSYGTVVVKSGDRKEFVTALGEENLTNAILKATRDEVKGVYFVTGHGEKDLSNQTEFGYSIVKQAIEKENYAANTISLFDVDSIPSQCTVLVIAGPKNDYFESEIEKIRTYLDQGKNAIFLIEPQTSVPNLEKLIASYRIILDDDVVIDRFSRIFTGSVTTPVVNQYENHAITKNFNVASFFPTARSLRIAKEPLTGVIAQVLAKTGNSSWGETDLESVRRGQVSLTDQDLQPPLGLAAISTLSADGGTPAGGSRESRIVVFGDSDFADNRAFRMSGNGDFFLNTVNFLAEEKDLIAIRPKESLGDRMFLTASQGRLIFLLSVIILPLAVISVGTSVFIRKRKRG